MNNELLHEISENLQRGKAKAVKELVGQAIDAGISPDVILKDGLLSGMNVIGEKFKANEVYVPEVLVAARAMNAGAGMLKPLLAEAGVEAVGKVCGEYIWAYPPGIPLLVPGEEVTEGFVRFARQATERGVTLHSTGKGLPQTLRVLYFSQQNPRE